MNHSAKISNYANTDGVSAPGRSWPGLLPVVGMVIYAVLMAMGLSDQLPAWFGLLIAPVMFCLTIYLWYSIARMTFLHKTSWLCGAAVLSVCLSFMLTGGAYLWVILTAWGVLLFAPVLTGKMTATGNRQRTIFILAMTVLMIFAAAQYWPLWYEVLNSASESRQVLVDQAEQQLRAMGESPENTRRTLEAFGRFVDLVIRLAPVETLLGAVMQFTVAYILFVRWVDRNHSVPPQYESYIYWKMPFELTPILIVTIVVRLFGGEWVKLVADNVLVFLTVFYVVMGLSLIEFYLRKWHVTMTMKVTLYILLFVVPLVHPTLALSLGVGMALIGFVDSFVDWRKVRLRILT